MSIFIMVNNLAGSIVEPIFYHKNQLYSFPPTDGYSFSCSFGVFWWGNHEWAINNLIVNHRVRRLCKILRSQFVVSVCCWFFNFGTILNICKFSTFVDIEIRICSLSLRYLKIVFLNCSDLESESARQLQSHLSLESFSILIFFADFSTKTKRALGFASAGIMVPWENPWEWVFCRVILKIWCIRKLDFFLFWKRL